MKVYHKMTMSQDKEKQTNSINDLKKVINCLSSALEESHTARNLTANVNNKNLLKAYSVQVSEAMQFPLNPVFLAGLTVVSSINCRRYSIERRGGSKLPISLYCVIEQPPSTGKTGVLGYFEKPFKAIMKKEAKATKEKIKELKKLMDSNDKAEIEALESKAHAVNSLLTTNTTQEALEASLNHSNGFFSAISSEQGLLNSMLGLSYGKGAPQNLDVVLSGRFGETVAVNRLSRVGYNGDVVGAICCFAQNGTIDNLLAASGGTGLFERFLFNAEPHKLGARNMMQDYVVCPTTKGRYEAKMAAWTESILKQPQPDFDQLPALKFSPGGYQLLAHFRQELEPSMADGARYSHDILRGAVGKVDAQVLSIAANLFLIDKDPDSGSLEIPQEYVISAIDIVTHQIESLLEACKNKGIIGVSAEISAIVSYLENKPSGATMQSIKNTVKQKKPFSLIEKGTAQAIEATVLKMLEAGLLTSKTAKEGQKGQEVTTYKNA